MKKSQSEIEFFVNINITVAEPQLVYYCYNCKILFSFNNRLYSYIWTDCKPTAVSLTVTKESIIMKEFKSIIIKSTVKSNKQPGYSFRE
jgi:hypothetical protein